MILLFRNCQHFLLSTKSSLWPWRLFIMWPSNYLFSFLSLSLSLTFLFAEDIPPKTEVMLFVMFTQLFSILSVSHVFLSILTALYVLKSYPYFKAYFKSCTLRETFSSSPNQMWHHSPLWHFFYGSSLICLGWNVSCICMPTSGKGRVVIKK